MIVGADSTAIDISVSIALSNPTPARLGGWRGGCGDGGITTTDAATTTAAVQFIPRNQMLMSPPVFGG